MKKEQIVKIIVLVIVVAIFIFLTIQLLPMFQGLSSQEGRMEFKTKIEALGAKGILAIIALMFAQVFLAILPGEPVEILAGMCYGAMGGMLVIFFGAFLSSAFIFFLVRKFGRGFIYSFVKKEKIEKLEHSKMFANPKTLDTILFILFFIPGTPKDLLAYIAGLLPIHPLKFLTIATFARFPSVLSSTIVGANLMEGNWSVIVMTYGISFAISGIVLYLSNRKGKKIEI